MVSLIHRRSLEKAVATETVEPEVQQENPVVAAVEAFRTARTAVQQFVADNQALSDEFWTLASEHNDRLSAVKLALKNHPSAGLDISPFALKKGASSTVFDGSMLTPEIRALPGVLVLDQKALKQYLNNPILSDELREIIRQAGTTTTAASAVTGPGEIALNLGDK